METSDTVDKEPAIIVREPDATMQPTPQNNQLMSKHRVLILKPQLRLEWRGQDGQSETEQPDHSASLGDSIRSSTRIRFSVHTGVRFYANRGEPLMISQFFEVQIKEGLINRYTDLAASLKPALTAMGGCLFIDRFKSLTRENLLLSYQIWQDGGTLIAWRWVGGQ